MDFASQDLTAGQLNAIVKKLGGKDGALRLLRGELVVAAKPIEMPVWKTVKLGICKTPDEYRKALKHAGRCIGNWGDDILGRIACLQEEVELDLVVLSVNDLGFKGGAPDTDVYANAVNLGLELCPAEVGPALRLQYSEQPRGECVQIAMEAITARDDRRRIFRVEHVNGDLCLYACYSLWHADDRFVFARRNPA